MARKERRWENREIETTGRYKVKCIEINKYSYREVTGRRRKIEIESVCVCVCVFVCVCKRTERTD